MKKTRILIFALLALVVIAPLAAKAFVVKSNDSIYVGPEEVSEGNFYAAGKNITIDGIVTGDLIAAGQNIIVNGTVEGDVIVATSNLTVNGTVKGNIRAAGESININGTIEKNVTVAAATTILGTDSTVGWDVLMAGESLESRGHVLGSLHGVLANLVIAGTVEKNVKFRLDDTNKDVVNLSDSADIKGDFSYTSRNNLNINSAVVQGTINYNPIKTKVAWGAKLWGLLIKIFSALVIGLLLVTLLRSEMKGLQKHMRHKPGKTLLTGLGILFLTPIVAFILMLTVIGLPLALILLAVWAIMIYISKVFVGIYVGQWLRKEAFKAKKFNLMADMVLGVVITWVLFAIPFLGPWLAFLTVLFGLGSIWFFKKDLYKKLNK